MKTLSLSEAKIKFSALVDIVNASNEDIIVTKNGRPAAVIISPDEYESIKETARIVSDADLMAEIRQGLNALKVKRAEFSRQQIQNHLPSCEERCGNSRRRSSYPDLRGNLTGCFKRTNEVS